ncbi:MAG TPA: hypothetical protein VME45_15250 [Stellaceae bacterium]|nr:hypothetical protein [Stellaceae bacterium]
MALPSDANIDLLICDAVRQTPDGKLDLAGYFPVPEVKIDVAAKLPVAINLTFVFVLKDGDGRYRPSFRLFDPMGQELHRGESGEFVKLPGAPGMVLLQIARIPVAVAGNYAIVLRLGDGEYRRSFRVYQ